jgi:hypothetical protein
VERADHKNLTFPRNQVLSGCPPMIGLFLVIEVSDTSDEWGVTLPFRPIDCFFLSFESPEYFVLVVFDYIIVNGRPFRATLGTGFHVNVRHSLFSLMHIAKRKLHDG